VDDFAALAVEQGKDRANRLIDAIGPETFTYRHLVEEISHIIGVQRPIISVSPSIGYAVGAVMGKLVGDVLITHDEIEGLMADRLVTSSPPAGSTRLTDWARQQAHTLGKHYASELARRKNRQAAYEQL
jgi:NADH dehydrogenase